MVMSNYNAMDIPCPMLIKPAPFEDQLADAERIAVGTMNVVGKVFNVVVRVITALA